MNPPQIPQIAVHKVIHRGLVCRHSPSGRRDVSRRTMISKTSLRAGNSKDQNRTKETLHPARYGREARSRRVYAYQQKPRGRREGGPEGPVGKSEPRRRDAPVLQPRTPLELRTVSLHHVINRTKIPKIENSNEGSQPRIKRTT